MALVALTSSPAAAAIVSDNFEGGAGQWTPGGTWGLTPAAWASPVNSATDSPGAFYTNNTDASLTLGAAVNLSGVSRPVLAFNHRYSLENGFDFARVEVSTNGGSSWSAPLASWSGESLAFSAEQLDLAAYGGSSAFKVRFRLQTDNSVVRDGWYVDDVKIGSAPPAAVLNAATGVARNSLTLTWNAAATGDFSSYEIYRSPTPGGDWRTAWKAGTLTDRTAPAFTDATLAPKTTYYFRVAVVNPDGLRSFSNEVSATTLAGMDFPVLDNGEAGGAIWTADAPWALSEEMSASGAKAWSDSPGGNYAPSTGSQALTLAAPVNLAATTEPVLCFSHRYDFSGGDYGYVEVSTNNGTDWTTLATISGASPGATWQRTRLSLAAHRQAAVLVRFRLTSDPGSVADGWHLDDISMSESPPVVPAPAVDQVTSQSARLTWQQSTDSLVTRYFVLRSTTTGAGINSILAATVNGRATTTFTDTGLLLDTNYYYRVYAANSYGGLSADSATEAQVHTLNNPPPFTDGFEGTAQNWIFTGTWGVTTESPATGAKCLTDSPGASYANSSDTWAETAVDLRGTEWPVLKFKDRYSLGGGDWLRVEVYDATNPGYWTAPYGVTESTPRTAWREQQIDLSPFKGRASVRIRFRVGTDGATPGDGWFIDDVSVTENPLAGTPLSLPAQEGFESGLTQWLPAGWTVAGDGVMKEGTQFAWDTVQERLAPDSNQSLTLAKPVVLPAGSNVQVTFWVRGNIGPGSWFRLQYSQDGGVSWGELATANLDNPFNSGNDWHRLQASLETLAGKTIRLRLFSASDYAGRAHDIRVDKMTIAEMPAAVTLTAATPGLRSVALTWTASTLGAAFQRYEVWRSTSANVTTFNGTKVFESASVAATSFTDTGLGIGATYYYRVFTVNARDTFIPSNEMTSTTTPAPIPLTDAMETMGNWVPGGSTAPNTWGIASTGVHGGSGCLALSPSGQYANSSDTWVETAVNLSAAEWPVLKFWDRFGLGGGDWMRVEIYDGNAPGYAITVYGATGEDSRTTWREQQIDLSQFKGRANVRIRFHVGTDGATPGDGWFIDDLNIAENPLAGTPATLPLQEGFESGLSQWISSGWISSDAVVAKDGTKFAWDTEQLRLAPDTHQPLTLARPVVLPEGSNMQVTFWVNGNIGPGSWFRLQYSQDGGVSWGELGTANLDNPFNSGANWHRLQASLQTLAGKTIRLRLFSASDYAGRAHDIRADKLTIAEMPAAVTLTSAVPGLRSVALTWTASTLGAAFQRVEVWRSSTAGVTVFNGTKIHESASAAAGTFTDTGLAIGATYYYRVFSVNTRDTFIPSNETAATTVPSMLPLNDPMETTGNWVPGGSTTPNTWGIATADVHGGSGSLALVTSGQYANSSDTWVETSVNLSTAEWPVLKFWDRYALGTGDWLRVEIFDGNNPGYSTIPYGVTESAPRTVWREQQIDLSQFKGRANVRIRFHVGTDGAVPSDGWFIDDLSVVENPLAGTAAVLPLQEGFESGLDQWISAGWITSDAVSAKEGTKYAWDTEQQRLAPDSHQALTLAKPLSLAADSNVQVTFWVRGNIGPGSWFRLQYSQDGGVTWPELSTANLDNPFNSGSDWHRLQASLQTLAGRTIRLRLFSASDYAGRAHDIRVDKMTISEMPAAVTLTSALPSLRTVDLAWTPSTLGAAFQRYELWRSTSASVSVFNGTKVFESTSSSTAAFSDTGLLIGQQYFYRVFTVDTRDTFIPSNELTATTVPALLPLNDPLENTGNWIPGTTGAPNTWGIANSGVHGGSGCLALTTSGQYGNSSDTWMETTVDLRGTVWPVLKFWDRYALGDGDWLRVEIYDGNSQGYSMSRYGIHGPAGNAVWRERRIDLSEFKGRGNVRLRFRVGTDGAVPSDGWFIDDLSVAENADATAPLSVPFFETFESGTSAWQATHWQRVPDSTAPGGSYALHDTESARCAPDTSNTLTLSRDLVLPANTTISVSYWIRGTIPPGAWFRLQYSQDGGVTWPELSAANLDAGYNSATWQLVQIPLTSLSGKTVRLRFFSASDYAGRASDILLDSIGIGEPAPAAPVLQSPVAAAWVSDVRPLLTLQNAIDVQSDPLTYRFEVYSDAALTTLVAQVPAVSGGSNTTSWQVDVNLPNNTRYWWRARANDGSADGPWSAAEDFYVNEVNHVPSTVVQVGPPNGAVLMDGTERLVWQAATDQDAGDFITAYHIQVSPEAGFTSPVIDVSNIAPPTSGPRNDAEPALSVTLGSLAGSASLQPGTVYYWRIRASDNRLGWSAWQSVPRHFRYQNPAGTGFQNWLTTYFTANELNDPALSGAGADPDGDGAGNLVEFAFSTNPREAASSSRPAVIITGNQLRIVYRQRTGGTGTTGINYTASGLRYMVERSTTPGAAAWQSGGSTVEFVAGSAIDNGDGTETVTVRSTAQTGSSPSGFLRLRVTME